MGRLTHRHKDGKAYLFPENGTGKVDYHVVRATIDKLAHYEDLEEADRLIELPCAVGDTVYVIDYEYEDIYIPSSKYYYVEARDFDYEMLRWMGEWCFLTKEEAEAKLKELEGDKE